MGAEAWRLRSLAAGAAALLLPLPGVGNAQDAVVDPGAVPSPLVEAEPAPLGVVDPTLFAEGGVCATPEDLASLSTESLAALATECCDIGTDAVFDVIATAQVLLPPVQATEFTAACLAAIAAAAGPIVPVIPAGVGDDDDPTLGGPSATLF